MSAGTPGLAADEKIVERQREGICYELDTLFRWLLEESGFDVYLAAAPAAGGTLIQVESSGPGMSQTRLTPELELDGIAPDEAFSILGNDIRLDIIRVLWEAGAANQYDDVCSATATMSFTELRRRVDITDNGKFNYHISKLTPHFVRQTDEGTG